MSRIRILSDHLANQIAAGEVVERPASVVKELVENSLDAGGRRITVQVEGGGTRLLRVVDDGAGMDGDDVLLCLERHATSKLQEESQLGAIATLGFRGEAIPSIASVSRLTLRSRPENAAIGTRAEVRYGTLHAVHEDGCAKGTVVEVKTLFGNIPARKKFLKSARTELFHIEEVVKNQALAHPETAFELLVDGRQRFTYPATDQFEERMRLVFGYQGRLLSLAGAEGDFALDGFLCLPEMVSVASARLRLFVNGRAVQDRMLRHGVMEGLQGFLMKGHAPAGVLRLTLPAADIDVNVHPAKREIRFRRPQDAHRFVTAVVRRSVAGYQDAIRSDLFAPAVSDHRQDVRGRESDAEEMRPRPRTMPFSRSTGGPITGKPDAPAGTLETWEPASTVAGRAEPEMETVSPRQDPPAQDVSVAGLTLIGQLFDLYLLCERGERLLVIDQHAAHERILYGRLVKAYLKREIPSQNLLFPVTVELEPAQAELLAEKAQEVARLGLQAEHFGDTTYVVKAIPALISQLSPEDILLDTLEALGSWSGPDPGGVPESVDALFASVACKTAIKAGNSLQPTEMLALLKQMEESAVFSHCPHGRPVIKEFSRAEIERWFHRT
ncbi:MAG TPA: DNA mismatch repair endonuclease MutL [Desulfobulbus sp.]|nr:DNA mismatch repair endonuclease MutL [Desulfobulbus sp.]